MLVFIYACRRHLGLRAILALAIRNPIPPMARFHVHLSVGKTASKECTIMLGSTPSHALVDYTVWYSYENYAMLKLGARNKEKLCPLWQFAPFRQKIANLFGTPVESIPWDRDAMEVIMSFMKGHEWLAALFDGGYYDAYIMESYHGGCDLYMRTPKDQPITSWWHYSVRSMQKDPRLW